VLRSQVIAHLVVRWQMLIEQWWNDADGENRRTRRETYPSATLSTTNPTWSDAGANPRHSMWGAGANPGLHGERLATNRSNHGTTLKMLR
jgi:hypothetical protein